MNDPYARAGRVHVPPEPPVHREDAFESGGFEQLRAMQDRHFWYRGRHRFLMHAVRRALRLRGVTAAPRVLDLGGGCGGWLRYWQSHAGIAARELALADSSPRALEIAAEELPEEVGLYQADLLDLKWSGRWDLIFLLDVIEHLDADDRALDQVREALVPGGLLFVTAPALRAFWSWNDEISGHRRRYRAADFRRLASSSGLALVDARYFSFFLSPLLWLSRFLTQPRTPRARRGRLDRRVEAMHRVPHPVINDLLSVCFLSESIVGHHVRFPWGTSILAVLRKPPGQS
jgi:SAM-dependent methyltransferase